MYTTIAKFTPLYDGDLAEVRSDHGNFEDAELNGRRNACLGGVIQAAVYNDDGSMVAYYNKLTNYWFVFKNDVGNFISRDEYFESVRVRQEQYGAREDLKIQIRSTEQGWIVIAGGITTPIEQEMFPWVAEAADWVMMKKCRREDEGYFPYDEEELLNMFNQCLHKRIDEAKSRNPYCLNAASLPLTITRLS